jgi:hypothetical protein
MPHLCSNKFEVLKKNLFIHIPIVKQCVHEIANLDFWFTQWLSWSLSLDFWLTQWLFMVVILRFLIDTMAVMVVILRFLIHTVAVMVVILRFLIDTMAVVVVILWKLDFYIYMQSAHITTYVVSLRQGVLDTTLCEKGCQWLAAGWLFSLCLIVSEIFIFSFSQRLLC